MNFHSSSSLKRVLVQGKVSDVEKYEFYSKSDGAWMVRVLCAECGRAFDELSEAAKVQMVCSVPHRCITCDEEVGRPGKGNRVYFVLMSGLGLM